MNRNFLFSPKVSIIVPVWNAEKYLKECINSILRQTFTDFELLLIDDGSEDSSLKICKEYADKDSRIRIFHKENEGVEKTRNYGIERVRGEYLMFVDNDDWIKPETLEVCMNAISGYDLVGFNVIGNDSIKEEEEIKDVDQLIAFIAGNPFSLFMLTAWSRIYRMNIIRKYNIRYVEERMKGEDTIFFWKYLTYCGNIKLLKDGYYNFSQRPNSLSKRYSENWKDYDFFYKQWFDTIDEFQKIKGEKSRKVEFIRYRYVMDLLLGYLRALENKPFRERGLIIKEIYVQPQIQSLKGFIRREKDNMEGKEIMLRNFKSKIVSILLCIGNPTIFNSFLSLCYKFL